MVIVNQTIDINQTRDKGKMVCAQVITLAVKDDECISYSTPCQVPEGWTIVDECPELKKNVSVFDMVLSFLIIVIIIAAAVFHKLFFKRKL